MLGRQVRAGDCGVLVLREPEIRGPAKRRVEDPEEAVAPAAEGRVVRSRQASRKIHSDRLGKLANFN